MKLELKTFSKIALAALLMGAALWGGMRLTENLWFGWQLALLIPGGCAVYFGVLLLTQAVTPEMKKLLRKPEIEKSKFKAVLSDNEV